MNILFLHAHAITPNSQGISKVLITLRTLFREKGHDVMVVAMKKIVGDEVVNDEQYFLPSKNLCSHENVLFLCNLIRNQRIDSTVNTCCQLDELRLLSECCHQCTIPLVTCLHGMVFTPVYNIAAVKEYELRNMRLTWLYYLLRNRRVISVLKQIYSKRHCAYYRNVYDYSDAVVLLNETMRSEFLEIIGGVRNAEKTYVIPNTLNGIIDSPVCRKEKIVLWVGKMDTSIKRPDLMLRVWQKVEPMHPEWRLMMLGKGSGTGGAVLEEMKGLAKGLNLNNVSFEGQVNTKSYYEHSEIVCVTSAHESFSLVLAEGLSNGVIPMAFSSFPTSMQLIKNGENGILIKPFDVDEYAEKLSFLMDNDNIRAHMRENHKMTLFDLSPDIVYNQWESLFTKVRATK